MSELPLIAELKGPAPIREDTLRSFGDDEEEAVLFAIRWAWDNRRVRQMTQRRAAELLGVPASHLSNILNGAKHLPPYKINAYEWIVGTKAVSQTIERFRVLREQAMVSQLAQAVAANIVRAA